MKIVKVIKERKGKSPGNSVIIQKGSLSKLRFGDQSVINGSLDGGHSV
jgi:hypothetical protein